MLIEKAQRSGCPAIMRLWRHDKTKDSCYTKPLKINKNLETNLSFLACILGILNSFDLITLTAAANWQHFLSLVVSSPKLPTQYSVSSMDKKDCHRLLIVSCLPFRLKITQQEKWKDGVDALYICCGVMAATASACPTVLRPQEPQTFLHARHKTTQCHVTQCEAQKVVMYLYGQKCPDWWGLPTGCISFVHIVPLFKIGELLRR